MTEIVQEGKSADTTSSQSKHKSSSKVLLFDANLRTNPLFSQLEVLSEKIAFHVGEKLYLSRNNDNKIVANTDSVEYSNLPCLELSVKRESLAALISGVDKAAGDKLLEETLDLNWKLELAEHGLTIKFVRVNHLREDIFVARYSNVKRINDPIGIEVEEFRSFIKQYQQFTKLSDTSLLQNIFLDSVEDLSSANELLEILSQKSEPVIVDESVEKKKKQMQMMSEMNLKDFVGDKILQLPVFKKDTGFFNYSQYQVFDIATQTFSAPIDIPKPNYNI